MASFNLTAQRTKILKLLAEAGPAGLPKTKLGVSNNAAGLRCREALQQLAAEGQVGDLGTVNSSRYVLTMHFNPLERAYDAILQRAMATSKNPIVLLSAQQLTEKLPAGPIKKEGDAALRLLVQEGLLVTVKSRNFVLYFARQLLPPLANDSPPPLLQWDHLVKAYGQLVQETQFSHVRIADLHRLLGKPDLAKLQEMLLDACRKGRAIPSEGDLSLATAEEKAAGLTIAGRLHLKIHIEL